MYLSGMSFYVLADHFLVHQSHPYEEEARKLERKSNRKVYQDFKEEVCLRFVLRLISTAYGQCHLITLSSFMTQVLEAPLRFWNT